MKSFLRKAKASKSTLRRVEQYIRQGWKPRAPYRGLREQRQPCAAGVDGD